eukprot:2104367-Rhodomonas_salina.3
MNAALVCEYYVTQQPPGARDLDLDLISCLAKRMLQAQRGQHIVTEDSLVDKNACRDALQGDWKLEDNTESDGNSHVFIGEHKTLQGHSAVIKVAARSCAAQLHAELSALLLCIDLPHVLQLTGRPGTAFGLLELGSCGLGLVMEHVKKVQLATAATSNQWHHNGLRCIHTLLVAVAGMHSRGLIHGDLSTSNVIINEEGTTVTLIDLGMAQSFKKGLFFYGTRGFRAPEFKGADSSNPLEAALVNELAVATDLWAAGATALCFAAGLPLLLADTDKGLAPQEQQQKQDDCLHEHAKNACSGLDKANWTPALAKTFAANLIPEPAVYECCSALLHYEAARRPSAAPTAAVLNAALDSSAASRREETQSESSTSQPEP